MTTLNDVYRKCGSNEAFIVAIETELRKLAEEKPDFQYKTVPRNGVCHYGGPCRNGSELLGPECSGCIFGQALQRLGWNSMIEMEFVTPIADLCGRFIGENIRIPQSWVTLQQCQDSCEPWSQAISALELNPFMVRTK